MVKKPDTKYIPNARSKSGWIKVKPEYFGNMRDTCDLTILGGYYTSCGRLKAGTLSQFLCGIKESEESKKFKSFCRVKNGLDTLDLDKLERKLKPYYQENPVKNIFYGKEVPDLKIDPKNSVVLQIRASGIIDSKSYAVGSSLR